MENDNDGEGSANLDPLPDHEERGEKKILETIHTDFTIKYYRKDPLGKEATADDEKGDSIETVCYGVKKVLDDGGTITSSQEFDRSSWRTDEIEQLIALRFKATEAFDKELLTNFRTDILWKNIADQLPRDSGPDEAPRKSGRECQQMFYMLMREFTSVIGDMKEETEFPFYQAMDHAWKYLRPTSG